MMAKMSRARAATEQAVHRGDIGGNVVPHRGVNRQAFNLLADGLGKSCRRFAGGGRQANTQRAPRLHRWGLEQSQQAHHGGGLAGTRTTGNDAEGPPSGQGAGKFLPVHLTRLAATGKQLRQARRQVAGRRFNLFQALAQGVVDLPFIAPVTTQVQTLAAEYQRSRGLLNTRTIGDQTAAGQTLQPGVQRQSFKQL
ncbi:hypothetical protein D3C72_1108350 [compost metagenome]